MTMRFASLAFLAVFAVSEATAEDFTPEQIKELALEAILENPQIVMEAVEILREREAEEQAQATEEAISNLQVALYNDGNAPVLGNPDGDVTVVEFFDYNCPYCKQAHAEVQALLEQDPNVRLIYREWPILSEGSLYASRAALAAREQGKYEEFHTALMNERARKDQAVVLRVAEEVGLDIEKLQADMESEAISEHIDQSNDMARQLGFSGTPSFVVGDEGLFGMVPAEDLIALVASKRQAQE